MARSFDGASQYLYAGYPAAALLPRTVTTAPLTLSAWFSATAANGTIVYVGNGAIADGWWLGINPTGNIEAITINNNFASYAVAATSTAITGSAWTHGCGVFTSDASRTAYLNAGSAVTETTSVIPAGTINTVAIACARPNGAIIGYFNGRIAEVGIWNVALTAAEVASLARGVSPLLVRPGSLFAYWPLIGRVSPDLELLNGLSVNVVNSPPHADHTRVYYPASAYVHALTPAPPEDLEIQPSVVLNPFAVFAPAVSADLGIGVPLISNPFTIYEPTIRSLEATIQEDSRELEPHNLKVRIVDFVAGDDLRISRLYTDLAGGILISKAYLTIKRLAVDNTDAEAVLQKTITAATAMSGEIVDNDTTGGSIQLFFDLSGSETALLTPLIAYNYDVQVHTVGNAVYTCEKGVIVMQQGVTDATS